MTQTLFETIQRIIQEELQQVRTAELAVVQEQHPHTSDSDTDNYACTVRLRNSGIVLKQVPVATSRIGSVSIPSPGDLVLVQFIGGDINAPVITGSFYNDKDRPPVNDNGQSIAHLPLGAGNSDAVHMELHSGDERKIVIKLGDGFSLTLHDDDPVVKLEISGGNAKVTMERDGALKVESQGNIDLKASGDISIQAQGQLTLKGQMVNIN